MIQIRNEARENARILHDMSDLLKAERGSLWREASLSPATLGRDGGNPCYVVATASGKAATSYFAVAVDDGSGYLTEEDTGIFLPSEHSPTFPLTEVTDGTKIVFGAKG